MAVHNAPGGYIQIDQAYGRLLQSKDHFETRQILLDALRSQKIRAYYFDGTGRKRDLSPSFWIMLESGELKYLNPFERTEVWKQLTNSGMCKVKNPISEVVESVSILLLQDKFEDLISVSGGIVVETTSASIDGVSAAKSPRNTVSRKGRPKVHDDAIFGAIIALVYAEKGSSVFSSLAEWRREALQKYTNNFRDGEVATDSWAKPIFQRVTAAMNQIVNGE